MSNAFTHRERLLRTLRFQPVDRVPDLEFAAWVQTIERWRQEGMAVYATTAWGPIRDYFGTDDDEYGPGLPIKVGLEPRFERTILENRGTHHIIQDEDGAISEQLKPELGASIPRYLRYAIESRADWERMRDERLDPNHPGRIPRYLDALVRRLDHREEMMEHLTQLTLTVLGKLAGKGLEIDRGDWWEDMCYNHGPLISPRLFAELMVPRYKRITDYLRREFGTEFNQLDCDGNIHELVPLWLEGGINVMFPIEVAHTDAYRISDQFGQRVALRGAFDKRALIAGPQAIDAEFERLHPLLERGGLIPHTDHLVPPDVSLENYLHYRRRKCEFIGKPWREPGLRHRPGHITAWRLLGPFDNQGNRGFHTALPPELEPQAEGPFQGKDGRQLTWQPHRGQAPSGYVDLAATVSPEPWVTAYAACALYSPNERDAWLELGSDDGLKVWLNGEEVWCNDVYRVAMPGQDLVPVRLRQGRNQVLLKIGQAEGGWGFYCRVTDEGGKAMGDVEVRG